MINRALLRIKVVQTLYAFYNGNTISLFEADQLLNKNVSNAYDLYHQLLLLMSEVTRYAEQRLNTGRNKYLPTEDELNPNTNFVDNAFVYQLRINEKLIDYVKDHELSWYGYDNVIKSLYESIVQSDYYEEYMALEKPTYEEDKKLWIKILKKEFSRNESLEEALEDISIFWNDDVDVVLSFVSKTVKQFKQEAGSFQALLPMFKDGDDYDYARRLLKYTIQEGDDFTVMIDTHTSNWEIERIASMDVLIMKIALAELLHFPSIPVNVTLNEYIDIAKYYSTAKSGYFVNGVLDKLVSELKKSGRLTKSTLSLKNEN